ncbi:hypothetical protein [Limibacterium fermenti]|jgi:hypothetical protein|uniref:hypothetical protein n=1 Tax=Limibacterium fermenti TaxID=3229863 RepID=UPI003A64C7D0
MKKIYFSLITIGVLLFSACSNDEPGNGNEEKETGTLTATISFGNKDTKSAQATTRASGSTAIPVVSWGNVKQVQLFLYGDDGIIAFSHILTPGEATNPEATDGRIFNIPNVPLGNYKMALLANTKSSTDNVRTSLDKGQTWDVEFTNANVRGKKIEDILVDVKTKDLPTIPDKVPAEVWKTRKGYDKPSEIFTAFYENVNITEGETKVVIPELKREISLMRTRFDITNVPADEVANRAKVKFDTENSFIVVQRLPQHFSLESGIVSALDSKKVFVGATGANTYRKGEDRPTGYKTPSGGDDYTFVDTKYSRWNEFHIFPNVEGRDGTNIIDKQYFIIIAAWVDLKEGEIYTYADGKIATKSQPVYWWALVKDEFTRNVIREVNLTLETAGYLEFPDEPTAQGSLQIEIGAPEEWNSTIVSTDMNI